MWQHTVAVPTQWLRRESSYVDHSLYWISSILLLCIVHCWNWFWYACARATQNVNLDHLVNTWDNCVSFCFYSFSNHILHRCIDSTNQSFVCRFQEADQWHMHPNGAGLIAKSGHREVEKFDYSCWNLSAKESRRWGRRCTCKRPVSLQHWREYACCRGFLPRIRL